MPGTRAGWAPDGALRLRGDDRDGLHEIRGGIVLRLTASANGRSPQPLHLPPMLLALDIGNTEITVGLFGANDSTATGGSPPIPTAHPDEWGAALGAFLLHAGHSPNEVRAGVIASVAPGVTQSLLEGVEALTGADVRVVDAASPLPIRLDVDEPLQRRAPTGSSTPWPRWSGITADTIVVDFGTATTFDCITADGRFIGGVIMPGLRTSADQLTRRAAKLPATELRPPERVIGRRTEECIRAGVLFGAADAVDGIVRRIHAEWPAAGRRPSVVATGGLAGIDRAAHHARSSMVDPDLTLHGLRIAARHLGVRW